jgi:molecular chaperone GrpE (heat shock protein)
VVVKKARKAAASARKRRVPAAPRVKAKGTPAAPAEGQHQHPGKLAPQPADTITEEAVDSLRRLLSELLERRLESIAGKLADVRREVAAGTGAQRILGLVDDLLHRMGAVRFAAEPLDVVDPLIHAVVEERAVAGVPRGVVIEALHPGFRSSRGLVLCKAAVAVSGG